MDQETDHIHPSSEVCQLAAIGQVCRQNSLFCDFFITAECFGDEKEESVHIVCIIVQRWHAKHTEPWVICFEA